MDTPFGSWQPEVTVITPTRFEDAMQAATDRTALDPVRKLDVQLAGRDLSFDPKNPQFRQDNSATLKQLEDAVAKHKKSFPESLATTEAAKILEYWTGLKR